VILVDSAGFNMKIAELATDAGVPVLYFITPQVWASRAGRLAKLAKTVTRAAVILPFEEKLLREHGINATFVGHPLLDRAQDLPDRPDARRQIGVDASRPLLALFPGSRRQEIRHHLEPFVETAKELQRRNPELQVVVSVAPHVTIDAEECPFPLIRASSFSIMRAADAAICKSGTTTLEAAVALCPMIVAYRTDALTYAIARRVVKIPYIGLVNVIAGREVAREFVQDAVVPQAMANTLEPLLDPSSPHRGAMVRELAILRASLGEVGAAHRVAVIAREMAEQAA
jgi:lipid-A-disaccharide synthase